MARNCAAYSLYDVQGTRVGERSAHLRIAVRALSLFQVCRFDAISRFLSLIFFFCFPFFFFRRASAADWSQRRHGVSSASPFSSCACRRLSRRGSALVRQRGRPRRRVATRATNATRRARSAIPRAILRSRTFLPSLFLPVCARSLRRPNEPDWLRALRLYDCGDKSGVASRRLPIERFGPILLNIIASGTTTIYLFPRASPVFPRCIAGEVAISRYRACLRAISFQLPARAWKRSFDVSFTRSFATCLFVLLLGNDLSKDRDATSSLDESRLESLS